MFKRLSYKFANMLDKNDMIENDDFEIYRYGFETLIYFIVNISIAISIGIIFNRFIHTIVFLSCYCTLRQFTGGYHARNYTECTITFVFTYLITIFMANNINVDKYKYLIMLFFMISIVIIYKLSPMENRNKPLDENEKVKYKKMAMKIVSFVSFIFISSIWLNIFKSYTIYLFLAITWISILLILGFCINKIISKYT